MTVSRVLGMCVRGIFTPSTAQFFDRLTSFSVIIIRAILTIIFLKICIYSFFLFSFVHFRGGFFINICIFVIHFLNCPSLSHIYVNIGLG